MSAALIPKRSRASARPRSAANFCSLLKWRCLHILDEAHGELGIFYNNVGDALAEQVTPGWGTP